MLFLYLNAMPILVLKQCIRLLLLSLFISGTIHAQEASASTPPTGDDQQAMRKISGIFDTDLPKTEQKGSVRLLCIRIWVTLPVGVTYAFLLESAGE